MTYKELLKKLRHTCREDGSYGEEVTLEDVLDDLATAGLEGASDLYMLVLKRQETCVRNIDPETGSISER